MLLGALFTADRRLASAHGAASSSLHHIVPAHFKSSIGPSSAGRQKTATVGASSSAIEQRCWVRRERLSWSALRLALQRYSAHARARVKTGPVVFSAPRGCGRHTCPCEQQETTSQKRSLWETATQVSCSGLFQLTARASRQSRRRAIVEEPRWRRRRCVQPGLPVQLTTVQQCFGSSCEPSLRKWAHGLRVGSEDKTTAYRRRQCLPHGLEQGPPAGIDV